MIQKFILWGNKYLSSLLDIDHTPRNLITDFGYPDSFKSGGCQYIYIST